MTIIKIKWRHQLKTHFGQLNIYWKIPIHKCRFFRCQRHDILGLTFFTRGGQQITTSWRSVQFFYKTKYREQILCPQLAMFFMHNINDDVSPSGCHLSPRRALRPVCPGPSFWRRRCRTPASVWPPPPAGAPNGRNLPEKRARADHGIPHQPKLLGAATRPGETSKLAQSIYRTQPPSVTSPFNIAVHLAVTLAIKFKSSPNFILTITFYSDDKGYVTLRTGLKKWPSTCKKIKMKTHYGSHWPLVVVVW